GIRWKMGSLGVRWERYSSHPGIGLQLLRDGLVAGWGIGVCGLQQNRSEDCEALSSECCHWENGVVENLRHRSGAGNHESRCASFFSRWDCLRLCLRADTVGSIRSDGAKVRECRTYSG